MKAFPIAMTGWMAAALLLTTSLPAKAEKQEPSREDASDDAPAKRRPRVRLAGIHVGVGYSHWSGSPYWSYPYAWVPGYWGYPYAWDPFFYGIHPSYFHGYAYAPNLGGVKVANAGPQASVYLDGAFAGQARKLKTMWLEPGAYNLEVREPSGAAFTKRIYVLSGRTLRLDTKEISR